MRAERFSSNRGPSARTGRLRATATTPTPAPTNRTTKPSPRPARSRSTNPFWLTAPMRSRRASSTACDTSRTTGCYPPGFDKAAAGPDIAVHGRAGADADFAAGGDRVRYSVDLAGERGPLTVEAALWYQSIGYRWAENLRPYDAPETRRFVGYYEAMASASGIVMARDSVSLDVR